MTAFDADVGVVGAGPVGLAAALACSRRGLRVLLLEKEATRQKQSRAIGITPPTLECMNRMGCVEAFVNAGVAVRKASGFDRRRLLAGVSFENLPQPWSFILAIPQHRTEDILESMVCAGPLITFRRGSLVRMVSVTGTGAAISVRSEDAKDHSVRVRMVMGCDGGKSLIRTQAGMAWHGAPYAHTFLMADYVDRTGWPQGEARLYFSPRGSIESFPLPEGLRRFVLRTPRFIQENTSDFMEREIPLRSGVSVDARDKVWESAFGVQRFLARPFAVPGLFVCGDAAHLLSPIGGQNMNLGFADAECAAWCVEQSIRRPERARVIAALYHRFRYRAAACAAWRAEMMMRCGTSGGFAWNSLRSVLAQAALNSPLKQVLCGMFSMLSLPNSDFAKYRTSMERLIDS